MSISRDAPYYTPCTHHHATRAEALECVTRRHRGRLARMDADLAVWAQQQRDRLERIDPPPEPPPPELLPDELRQQIVETLAADDQFRAAVAAWLLGGAA